MTGTTLALAALFLVGGFAAYILGYSRGERSGMGWERLRCCRHLLAYAKKRDLILELTPLREQIASGAPADTGEATP